MLNKFRYSPVGLLRACGRFKHTHGNPTMFAVFNAIIGDRACGPLAAGYQNPAGVWANPGLAQASVLARGNAFW